ncbi:hypothetical protein [Marinobacter salarius]|uniref:hypothetical protein n=1 Tax=Marinobacter salarius TaxID=1420917 RepID=UPI003D0F2EE6
MFFARLVTIYGRSKTKTIWGSSEDQLRVTRREWAKTIGEFSVEQLESMLDKLKQRLSRNDERYEWPDIPKILGLVNESDTKAAHKVLPRGLPEPEWRKEQRRTVGKIASQTALAVVAGTACFIEDRPGGES